MQSRIHYGTSTAMSGYPKQYSFNGYHPSLSASSTRQELRAATLYEDNRDANRGNTQISPTHQFFSRLARPRGYLAVGREVMIVDSSLSVVHAGMIDLCCDPS